MMKRFVLLDDNFMEQDNQDLGDNPAPAAPGDVAPKTPQPAQRNVSSTVCFYIISEVTFESNSPSSEILQES